MTTIDLRRESDAIAARRLDAVKTLTDTEREAALLRFADLAIQGDFPTDALPAVIERLAATGVTDVMVRFDDLCDAVSELSSFEDDPDGWCDLHDLSPRAWLNVKDRLCGEVAWAVRAILHGGRL